MQISYGVVKKPLEVRLLEAACIYWNVDMEYLKQKSDKQVIVYRRKLLYYLIRKETALSLRDVSDLFDFANSEPVRKAVEEIETTKNIYRAISSDLDQLLKIANNLDAQIITMQVELHTTKF